MIDIPLRKIDPEQEQVVWASFEAVYGRAFCTA